jgi:hypothetical protein
MNKLNQYNSTNIKSFTEILKEKGITTVFKSCHNKVCFCTGLCMEISYYENSTGKIIKIEDINNYIK